MKTLKIMTILSIILGIGLLLLRVLFVAGAIFAALKFGMIPTGELFSDKLVIIIYVALIGMLANLIFTVIPELIYLLKLKIFQGARN